MSKLFSLTIPGNEGPVEIEAPDNIPTGGLESDGGKLIGLVLTWLLIAGVLLALGFLIYGGFNWIMSQGDKTKLESARRTVIFAVLGLIIVFASFFLVSFIGSILGVNLFQFTI